MMTLSRLVLVLLLAFFPGALQADDTPDSNDPFEPVNRKIYAFNEGLDEYVLRPVAKGYRVVTPDPVERGVSNFIANILEFNTIINSVLQGRAADALHSTGRFFVNTTVGLGRSLRCCQRHGGGASSRRLWPDTGYLGCGRRPLPDVTGTGAQNPAQRHRYRV